MRITDASIWQSVGYAHAGTSTQRVQAVRACAAPWKEFCLGENRACSVAVARGQVGTYAGVGLIQCIIIDSVLWNNEGIGFEGRGSHSDIGKGKPEEREETFFQQTG